jgi:hypothetical protein
MVWFFKRRGESLQVETRYESAEYVLTLGGRTALSRSSALLA